MSGNEMDQHGVLCDMRSLDPVRALIAYGREGTCFDALVMWKGDVS